MLRRRIGLLGGFYRCDWLDGLWLTRRRATLDARCLGVMMGRKSVERVLWVCCVCVTDPSTPLVKSRDHAC
jgi:hypothetical protein